jgi:fluoride ion exporter CrcB/FEX
MRRSTDGGALLAAAAREAGQDGVDGAAAPGELRRAQSDSGWLEHQKRIEDGRSHHHVNTFGKLKALSRAVIRQRIVKLHIAEGHHVASAIAAADDHHDALHREASTAASRGVCASNLSQQSTTAKNNMYARVRKLEENAEAGGIWVLAHIAHILRLDRFLDNTTQQHVERRKRVLGHAKYRTSSILSIETLWLWTMGLTAEAGANVGMVLLCEALSVEALLRQMLPTQIDVQLTLLNLSGAMFDGAAVYLAKWHLEFHDPPLLLVFRAGFCSVWTSLAGVVEHAAALPPLLGLGYLSVMLVAGVAANDLGRRLMQLVVVPLCVSLKVLKHAKHIVHVNLSETLWDDALFYACLVFMLCCGSLCRADYLEYDASELVVGFLCVPLSFAFGTWVEGDHEWARVQWGTWRCNFAAFVVLVATVAAAHHAPWVAAFALHRRIAATFCGALSSFNGFSGDTTELLRRGLPAAAAANFAVNWVTALAFVLALQGPGGLAPWHSQAAADGNTALVALGLLKPPLPPPPPPRLSWQGLRHLIAGLR